MFILRSRRYDEKAEQYFVACVLSIADYNFVGNACVQVRNVKKSIQLSVVFREALGNKTNIRETYPIRNPLKVSL